MRRASCLLALALGVGVVGACAKQAGQDAAAPGPGPAFAAPGLTLEEYEQLLAQNEVALRQQGVRVPPSGTRIARGDVSRDAEKRPADGAGADYDDAAAAEGEQEEATITGGAAANRPGAAPEPAQPFPAAEDAPAPESAPARGAYGRRSRNEREREPDRCEMICELAAATCDLEAKICDLAQQHAGDPRYQNACERARQDCAIAQEACLECAP